MAPQVSPEVVLDRPGVLTFPSNRAEVAGLLTRPEALLRTPTGHLVWYGAHGRRVLATDPEGHPLHECEWGQVDGTIRLLRARVRLDWGRWVGVVPSGLVNATRLDLSRKPGWQRLRPDDLRGMAAQAMQVPLSEVRCFYTDRDLTISPAGVATIRHRKDAIVVLPDGSFDRTVFMACMGAMHWEEIDFLPVVELFLSLLPGTGSAIFELIRGLYDDQNRGRSTPQALRYRGIPTYPSAAAYRLFSAFFTPRSPGGRDPFSLFMDQTRSHEVTWLPVPDPPRRYVEEGSNLCVTIQGFQLIKATLGDDPAGLSYYAPEGDGFAPCERAVGVEAAALVLTDRDAVRRYPLNPLWGTVSGPAPSPPHPVSLGWTSVFEGPAPVVNPAEAFAAVLLYPDDRQEIGELATQPFVADYLQDLMEQDQRMVAAVSRAARVLINGFDAALTACIGQDRPRHYTILYGSPAFAQRQAQGLWNAWARARRLDWLAQVRMQPQQGGEGAIGVGYELAYDWIPFELYARRADVLRHLKWLAQRLTAGAVAFVVGPPLVPECCGMAGLQVNTMMAVDTLPTFRMHQSIVPAAQLKTGVTLFSIVRR